MAKDESKMAKLRTYQVQMVALLEEKSIGLLTDDEFSKRHKELWDLAMGDKA
jgi:hypothetical protein